MGVCTGVSTNGGPQKGWYIREIPMKIDDLGVPPILGNLRIPNKQSELLKDKNHEIQLAVPN